MKHFWQNKIRRGAGLLALAIAAAWLGAPAARADLVWTPDGGWKFEGGVLGPLFGDMGASKSALEAMNKAKTAQEAGHYWSALSQYDQVLNDFPGSVFAPEALFQEGVVYMNRHQFERAFDCFDTIIKRYPDYPSFNGVIRQQFKVADLISTERPYLWGWMPWFKNPEKALDYYDSIAKNAPSTQFEFASMALMKIALVALEQSSIFDSGEGAAKAIDALKRLVNEHPESLLRSDAYLMLADIYSNLVVGPPYDQGSTRQAVRYLDDYLFFYKESANATVAEKKRDDLLDVQARSQLVLGDFFYYYRNGNRAALIFYNQAITLAPQSPAANEARAQIDKINHGILAPMTPYDMLFGRYNDHALSPADEQGKRIDQLAADAFAKRPTSQGQFEEKPGDEAVESISFNGQPLPETGAPFLPAPGATPVIPGSTNQMIPVLTPPSTPSDKPLLR